MRYGTVGTGWITDAFIEGAAMTGAMELAAVYSRDAEKGQAFAAKQEEKIAGNGTVSVFTGLEAMASYPLIDAVYIASPNILHYEQSKLFLEHGKHVLCEKPVTVTADQFSELSALAKSKRLIYMEAIMMRHLPARSLLHGALKKVGHVTTARLDFSQLSSKYPLLMAGQLPNIFNPKMATGCLMDLGVYCVYAALDLFGTPQRVTASAGFLPSGADGFGAGILDYEDKQVFLTYSKVGESRLGSEIIGDQGTLTIRSISKLTEIDLISNSGERKTLVGDFPKATLMSGEAADFCRYIADSQSCTEEIDNITALAGSVCKTMEQMRSQAGIRFS